MGATRQCEGFCGLGLETCAQGYWQSCVVPDVTRSCSDACGAGTQLCTAGAWQSCVVPDSSQACTNTCGSGTQQCTAGVLHSCVVAPATLSCSSICGAGTEPCVDDTPGVCNAPVPHNPVLHATFLDFHSTQNDFEGTGLPVTTTAPLDLGIVQQKLDANNLPVYAPTFTSPSTTGKQDFDVWFRSTPGVNVELQADLTMTPAAGNYFTYQNYAFFVLDNQGFGNEGQPHNYDFTMQAETSFVYMGGETFNLTSDDDSWLFLNRSLAIDLGGRHQSESGSVVLDAAASELGLVVGKEYPLNVFYVERHVTGAVFGLTSTIAASHQCG